MNRPRLVATDLDGTVVRSDGSIADRTRDAIARLESAGVPFVMVTGRPPRWMAPIAEATGHRGLAVCANGAVLYDLHTEKVVEQFLLAAAVAQDVVDLLRAQVPEVAFGVEHPVDGFGHEASYLPRWEMPGLSPRPVADLVAGGIVKLLARAEGMGSDDLLAAAQAAVGDRATLTHSSADGLLEVSAAGISKASGLALMAERFDVDADAVIAFGDMPNDLPMLGWAGHGVAVANAHPQVLDVADEVTASNDEDGVAQVLERWF